MDEVKLCGREMSVPCNTTRLNMVGFKHLYYVESGLQFILFIQSDLKHFIRTSPFLNRAGCWGKVGGKMKLIFVLVEHAHFFGLNLKDKGLCFFLFFKEKKT